MELKPLPLKILCPKTSNNSKINKKLLLLLKPLRLLKVLRQLKPLRLLKPLRPRPNAAHPAVSNAEVVAEVAVVAVVASPVAVAVVANPVVAMEVMPLQLKNINHLRLLRLPRKELRESRRLLRRLSRRRIPTKLPTR